MESALERQLQEKALFRSPSRSGMTGPIVPPAFITTTWTGASHSIEEEVSPLDPLDEFNQGRTGSGALPRGSLSGGGAPGSWCHWSSHTRADRCGSAGLEDCIITRDFAWEKCQDAKPTSSGIREGRRLLPSKAHRVSQWRNIKRYYIDLFTTVGFRGKGRRTSVWSTSGTLVDPELEMLPAVVAVPAKDSNLPRDDLAASKAEKTLGLPGTSPFYGKGRRFSSKHDAARVTSLRIRPNEYGGSNVESKTALDQRPNPDDDNLLAAREVAPETTDGASDLLCTFPRTGEEDVISTGKREKNRLLKSCQTVGEESGSSPSKAEEWSAVYSECISRPYSPDNPTMPRAELSRNVNADEEARPPVSSECVLDAPSEVCSLALESWAKKEQQGLDETARPPGYLTPSKRRTPDRSPTLSSTTRVAMQQEAEDEAQAPSSIAATTANAQQGVNEEGTASTSITPSKQRKSEATAKMDPEARIRRFPSVTVVDDRKGHWRSVSLISVRSSTSFFRESSNDLLRLLEEREREERDKLMSEFVHG